MSDFAPEPTASPAEPTPAPANAVTPAPTPASVSIGEAGDPAELARREWQARHDRVAAEKAALERRLAELESNRTPAFSLEDIDARVSQALLRTQQLTGLASSLRDKYPDVATLRPQLFEGLHRYDSPEAFEAAVEAEAQSLTAALQARDEAREREIRERYEKAYGRIVPPVASETAPSGLPTPDQLAEMTQDELDAVEAEYGEGVIDRILFAHMGD